MRAASGFVDLAEAIEAALLHAPVSRDRLGCFGLERAMESLMGVVLLRVGGLDAQPPDPETGRTAVAVGAVEGL